MKTRTITRARNGAIVLNPTPRRFDVLAALLTSIRTGGNLVSDAHLAAVAIERRATVVTYDADFAGFAHLRTERPT